MTLDERKREEALLQPASYLGITMVVVVMMMMMMVVVMMVRTIIISSYSKNHLKIQP